MTELIIFFVGIASGFLGATVGGGGFISIPALLWLGFTPQSAIALNKVGDIGTFISAVKQYWGSKKIDWKMAIPLVAVYIIGSVVGTQIMVLLSVDFLEFLILITILLAAPLVVINKKLGIKKIKTSRTKKIIGWFIFFLLAIDGAAIGAGGAAMSTLVMMYFFGYEIVKGHATSTPSKFFSAAIPTIIYSFYGFVYLLPAIAIFLGMLIGGFFGANMAIDKGNRWVKILFTIVMVVFVIKLVFFN